MREKECIEAKTEEEAARGYGVREKEGKRKEKEKEGGDEYNGVLCACVRACGGTTHLFLKMFN